METSRDLQPTDPSKKCPKEEHFELMLISYCCSSEKVCLHLFSWPCLQWMSRSFAYLTNVPSYECTITRWCFRWKERFSVLWKCPNYRVTIFVIFPKGLTHGLSWKIENWTLFVFVLNRPKNSVCWCFRWKERHSGLWKCPIYRVPILVVFPKGFPWGSHGLSGKIEIETLVFFWF